jgi:hypothetical protein
VIVGKKAYLAAAWLHLEDVVGSPEHLTYSVLAASRAADLFMNSLKCCTHCVTPLLLALVESKREVATRRTITS